MIKKVTFTNTRNEKIHGVVKEGKPSDTLIIVCHGFKSSKEHPANGSITDKLYAMGHTTFSFDFSESAQGIHLKEQVSDIIDTVTFFKGYKRIILLAGSFGALGASIAATKISRTKGLITINGFFGSGKLGREQRRFYFFFRLIGFVRPDIRRVWKFLHSEYHPEQIGIPTLVIHAKDDAEVLSHQSQDFFNKVAGEKELHLLEKADHHLTRESYRQEIATIIDEWIKKHP